RRVVSLLPHRDTGHRDPQGRARPPCGGSRTNAFRRRGADPAGNPNRAGHPSPAMKLHAVFIVLLAAGSAAAQEPPAVTFDQLEYSAGANPSGGELTIAANAEPLSSDSEPSFLGSPLPDRDFSIRTLMDFSALAPGDIAGLAARRDGAPRLAIQV